MGDPDARTTRRLERPSAANSNRRDQGSSLGDISGQLRSSRAHLRDWTLWTSLALDPPRSRRGARRVGGLCRQSRALSPDSRGGRARRDQWARLGHLPAAVVRRPDSGHLRATSGLRPGRDGAAAYLPVGVAPRPPRGVWSAAGRHTMIRSSSLLAEDDR
jgi:hypothetical protein